MLRQLVLIFIFLKSGILFSSDQSELLCATDKYPEIISAKISVNLHYDVDKSFSCNSVSEYQKIINKVNNFSGMKTKVFLSLFHKSDFGFCSYGNTISIPLVFITESHNQVVMERTREEMLVIFAHEYGHSILNKKLANDFPVFKNIFDIQKKVDSYSRDVSAIYAKISKFQKQAEEAKRSGDNYLLEQIMQNISIEYNKELLLTEKIEEYSNLLNSNPVFDRFISVISSYHELFADLISALTFESPNAFANSIHMHSHNQAERLSVSHRDFSVEHEVNGWEVSDDYGIFSPVRFFIWNKLWDYSHNNALKKQLVDKLYNSIKEEIKFRLSSSEQLSPEELNIRLIDKLY